MLCLLWKHYEQTKTLGVTMGNGKWGTVQTDRRNNWATVKDRKCAEEEEECSGLEECRQEKE